MRFRFLDVDDLLILAKLGKGLTVTEIAKIMNLCQPAVSRRMINIRYVCKDKIFIVRKHRPVLTRQGEKICRSAGELVSLLVSAFPYS